MFWFDRNKSLVSYLVRNNKIGMLLSSMHAFSTINEITVKPDIVRINNETKVGVGIIDQLCSHMNRSCKTRPLVIFYDVLTIASMNSYVIFCLVNNKPVTFQDYMLQLEDVSIMSWLN